MVDSRYWIRAWGKRCPICKAVLWESKSRPGEYVCDECSNLIKVLPGLWSETLEEISRA